jgi:hypothetical protein
MKRLWKRTIYVYAGDEYLWERAIEYAESHNMSLSKLIVLALLKYLL